MSERGGHDYRLDAKNLTSGSSQRSLSAVYFITITATAWIILRKRANDAGGC